MSARAPTAALDICTPDDRAAQPHWSGVFAMTLCVFTLIASEFMPVSLLTPLARDLHVSEGLAGAGVAISGAFAVLTSLSIAKLAGRTDRKTLLLGLTGLMAVSGATVGLAPGYGVYTVGRALIGVVIGGFWSMSAATAMRLVPSRDVPRALAIFNGGNALATVVAAPLGSCLGSIVGWRGAFFCVVPIALAALAWQWSSLPAMPSPQRPAQAANVFRLCGRPVVAWGMLATGLLFMGQFTLFTYVRPFLEGVTRLNVPTLSLILLLMGIAGFVGTTVISPVLKWRFHRTLVGIPLLMAAIAVLLVSFGSDVLFVAALLSVWGLVGTAAPVGWWSWLARTLPEDAETGGGLMVAVIQLAIALGSSLGGLLFDRQGYQSTFIASAMLLVLAAVLAEMTSRRAERPKRSL